MAKSKAAPEPDDIRIGKFDILATYTYAKSLLDGIADDEAKQRGMVVAILGAQAKLGIRHEDRQAEKEAAERKRKTTITADAFARQVAHKLGAFFDKVFLPAMKRLVAEGRSYESVKALVAIPATWGAKITGKHFQERIATAESEVRPRKRIVRRRRPEAE